MIKIAYLFYFKDASSMDEAEKVGGSVKDAAGVMNIHTLDV